LVYVGDLLVDRQPKVDVLDLEDQRAKVKIWRQWKTERVEGDSDAGSIRLL
jgi:hypothetical protein